MSYVRIYSDDSGESHFEDVAVGRAEESDGSDQWLTSAPYPVADMRFRKVISEYPGEPHVAPRRQFIILLTGVAEIEVSDGEIRQFGPGSVLLVEDVVGKGHTTRRIGTAPRETIFLPTAN